MPCFSLCQAVVYTYGCKSSSVVCSESRQTVLFLGKVFKALHSFDSILNQSLQFAPPPNHRFLFRRTSFHTHTPLIPKYNKASYGCKSFDSLAATLWNSLPDFLRVCNSLDKFKSLAKILFLEF